MPTEKRLTVQDRHTYLLVMKDQYAQATSRAARSALLEQMVAYTGLHRKSLLRLLHQPLERQPRQRQRGKSYGPEVQAAVLTIADCLDYPCASRLTPVLAEMAQHLAALHALPCPPALLEQLQRISISTVSRILQQQRPEHPKRFPRQAPQALNPLRREVPVQRIPWHEQQPGHCEVDLVQHSGPTPNGECVYTLTLVDVATGWLEQRALLGRSFLVLQDAFRVILSRLPFPLLELHSDNGSEFFSAHLRRFWQERLPLLRFSRSRPYYKNDNRFVEQRNASQVRAYVGHGRFDTVAQVQFLNQLYDRLWLYYNLFQPILRLQEKTVRQEEGAPREVRRQHDQAQTPFVRLGAKAVLAPERQEALLALRATLHPGQLRREIQCLLDQLLTLPGAVPGEVQDVFLTLAFSSLSPEGRQSEAWCPPSVTLSVEATSVLPSMFSPSTLIAR